jgi:DNA-binding CsgD family transcriptional regulator
MTIMEPSTRLDGSNDQHRHDRAAEILMRRQEDLVSVAARRAADDACAAIGHQLSEPLTALLLYLTEIKRRCEPTTGTEPISEAFREVVEMALRATVRTCAIMEQVGHPIDPPVDAKAAVARGSEVIDSWNRNGVDRGLALPPSLAASGRQLTPREQQVLALIADGASNKAGGHRLGISTRTFEAHRAHIMRKLGANNVADLVRIALSVDKRLPVIRAQ